MNHRAEPTLTRRQLRISYLIQQFPLPTQTFAISDIAELIGQGHDVSVYTLKFPRKHEGALARSCAVPPYLHVDRPSWGGALSWPKLLWRRRNHVAWLSRRILRHSRSAPVTALQAFLCLPRLLEIADKVIRSRSDVVHAFWSRHVGLVLPILKCDDAPMVRSAFLGAYDLVADDFVVDAIADSAQILFSQAEVNRPFLKRKASPQTSVEIVRRGIPLARALDEIGRDPFRLATASALDRSKNVEAVIRGFAFARMKRSELTLKIFGCGPDRSRLERLAQHLDCAEAVSFCGHVPRDELFVEMQRSSTFLCLSKKPSERLPNVLKEALWAGCWVISSGTVGIEELLPDRGMGMVVDPDDQEAVARAVLRQLSESKADAERRRLRVREFIADNFSSACSMRSYVEAWRRFLPSSDPAGLPAPIGDNNAGQTTSAFPSSV